MGHAGPFSYVFLFPATSSAEGHTIFRKTGFHIGGLDTNVYKGTKQEGKADIIFYCDC